MKPTLLYTLVVGLGQLAAAQQAYTAAQDSTSLETLPELVEFGTSEAGVLGPRAPKGGKGGGGGTSKPKPPSEPEPPKKDPPKPSQPAAPPKESKPAAAPSSEAPKPPASSATPPASSAAPPASSAAPPSSAAAPSSVVPSSAAPSSVAPSSAGPSSASPSSQPVSITSAPSVTSSGLSTLTTATSEAEACPLDLGPASKRNGPRAPTRAKPCKPDPLHKDVITKSTSVLKTFTETCSVAKAGQACYHYYSAIKNNQAKGWDLFTCSDDQKRHDGSATAIWEREHPKNQWRDYLPKSFTDSRGVVSCQRDEWPPGFFMPSDTLANLQNKNPQIIRWLPQADNDAGGKIWQNFCTNNDGGKGNGQLRRKNKAKGFAGDEPNLDLVDLEKAGNERVKNFNGKKTTTTEWEAKFTRAVFSLAFDWAGQPPPAEANDWYLSENPCWPKAIASDDPGYNIFTDDNWYKTAGTPAQRAAREEQKKLYAAEPPAAYLNSAVKPVKRGVRGQAGTLSGLDERQFEILEDGFGVRSANASRRLEESEFEVIQCASKDCAEERRALDEEEIAAVIPAPVVKKSRLPEVNVVLEATPVPAVEDVGVLQVGQRLSVSPELPVATASW